MIYIDGACYYYRNKAAQKEDNKTMYRYINYIYKNKHGNYVIKTADNVTRQYIFYSLKEAIKKANNDYKERKQKESILWIVRTLGTHIVYLTGSDEEIAKNKNYYNAIKNNWSNFKQYNITFDGKFWSIKNKRQEA